MKSILILTTLLISVNCTILPSHLREVTFASLPKQVKSNCLDCKTAIDIISKDLSKDDQADTLYILDSHKKGHAKAVSAIINLVAKFKVGVIEGDISDDFVFYGSVFRAAQHNSDIINMSITDNGLYVDKKADIAYEEIFRKETLLVTVTPNTCSKYKSRPKSINSERTITVGNYRDTFECEHFKPDIFLDLSSGIYSSSFSAAAVSGLIAHNNLSKLPKKEILIELNTLYPDLFVMKRSDLEL